jgi:peptidoglycan/LPS O-acetylase OafA/YrhL
MGGKSRGYLTGVMRGPHQPPTRDAAESSASHTTSTMPRLAALDGIRGLAVAAVVVNHARPSALAGGWLGVDVFFVLSGFLITSLLLREHAASGRIDLGHFYSRRARRLLPALFVLLAAVVAVARVAPDTAGFDTVRGDGLAALAYVANWHFIAAGTSYFGAFAPSPLRHLWSLAIEEQFYLVWPVLLILLLRRGRARTVTLVAGSLAIASAIAMALRFDGGTGISRAYFGTDTHAHGLLVGCACAALLASGWRVRVPRVVAVIAAIGVAAAMFELQGTASFAYRGAIFGVAILTAIVVAAVASGHAGPLAWVLERRPLVGLGRISYGVYLWHWPVLLVLTASRMHVTGWPLVGEQVAVTLGLSLLSYALLERPVLRGWPRARIDAALVVTAAAVAAAVALVAVVPDQRPPFAAAQQVAATRSADRIVRPVVVRGAKHVPVVLVVGDSVAYTLVPGLEAYERRAHLYFITAAQTGCPLDIEATALHDETETPSIGALPSYCDWPHHWPQIIARTHPDVVVALWGLWDAYDARVRGHWLNVGTPEWAAHMRGMLGRAVGVLSARGAHVVVLSTPYTFGASHSRVDALNHVFASFAASDPRQTTFIDIQPLMNTLAPERWDAVHFTDAGATTLGRAVVPLIAHFAPIA